MSLRDTGTFLIGVGAGMFVSGIIVLICSAYAHSLLAWPA